MEISALEEDPRIDKSFRSGNRPAVLNVGDLIKELSQLPEDLEFMDAMTVSVSNLNFEKFVVVIGEFDEDFDEVFDEDEDD